MSSIFTLAERPMIVKLLEHGTVSHVSGTIRIGNETRDWEIQRHNSDYFSNAPRYSAYIRYHFESYNTPDEAINALDSMIRDLVEMAEYDAKQRETVV